MQITDCDVELFLSSTFQTDQERAKDWNIPTFATTNLPTLSDGGCRQCVESCLVQVREKKNAGVWVQSHNYACAVAHALTITEFTHQGGKWIQSRFFFYADQHETWLNDEVEDMETWVQRKEHSTTELSADLLTVLPVILHKSLNN